MQVISYDGDLDILIAGDNLDLVLIKVYIEVLYIGLRSKIVQV